MEQKKIIVIQIVFKVYQWEAEQFGGSSVDFTTKEFDNIYKPNVRNLDQKLQSIRSFQDCESTWKKLNYFFKGNFENKNMLLILLENYLEKLCILPFSSGSAVIAV